MMFSRDSGPKSNDRRMGGTLTRLRSVLAGAGVLLLLVQPADAFPWKRIAKVAVVWGAPLGSSLLATKGTFDCRHRFGPEPCSEHYGEAKAFEGVRAGFSLSMSTISWKCLSGTGDKACYSFAAGTTAFNTYWWHREEVTRAKKD